MINLYLRNFDTEENSDGLGARIGVDTGEVILQPGGDTPVFGDAPQVASQLRELATTGDSILTTERTETLARDRFALRRIEGASAADGTLFSLTGRARLSRGTRITRSQIGRF